MVAGATRRRLPLPLPVAGVLTGLVLVACTSLEGLMGGVKPGDDGGTPVEDARADDARRPEDARVEDALADGSDAAADVTLDGASIPVPDYLLALGDYQYAGVGAPTLTQLSNGNVQENRLLVPMTGSMTVGGPDCYTFTMRAAIRHTWSLDFCRSGDRLLEVSGKDIQTWFGTMTNTASWRCDAGNPWFGPAVERDLTAIHDCQGQNSVPATSFRQAGLMTFLGRKMIDVEGADVPVFGVEVRRTVSGAQAGTQTLKLWIAVATGVPVEGERAANVTTTAPVVGTVEFEEMTSFKIYSMRPSSPDAGADASRDARDD
ncbi:MAG: hypothetical protein IPQ09_24980 [Myxococcales bacterium]|nr:hypothetical protein [Myxococcales bacterium]HQY62855.1 hypothetical protein [Polyangiaceae bacterium]